MLQVLVEIQWSQSPGVLGGDVLLGPQEDTDRAIASVQGIAGDWLPCLVSQ